LYHNKTHPSKSPFLQGTNSLVEADSVDRVAEMVDADAVVEIEAEDVDHLLKRQPTYLRPVYRLLH
jgi:hypothetical protein